MLRAFNKNHLFFYITIKTFIHVPILSNRPAANEKSKLCGGSENSHLRTKGCIFFVISVSSFCYSHTMISDAIQQQLEKIAKKTFQADKQLAIQRNKLMKPIYAKRRDILKQVPNFWGTAVSASFFHTHTPALCMPRTSVTSA